VEVLAEQDEALVRYLKNVTGFWLLEQCAAEWGGTARELLELAADAPGAPVFDVRDERFLGPPRMADEVRAAAGLDSDVPRAVVARSIVESVAAAVARVVNELRRQAIPVHEVAVVGGGAASPLVRDLIARHAGVHVVAGATEATALGNAMLQGISCGRFRDLAEARAWARRG
jgi:rhamnulokinase